MQYFTFTALAALATSANAALIQVAVGKDGLTYTPSDITAAVGDLVEFSFYPKNHTVTQSSFANPCHPLAGGFFSTFIPTASSPSTTTFTITVNDTEPIWLYCGQPTGNHCQSGMVAAINAPTSGNTLVAFEALAKNATTSTSPPNVKVAVGGVLSLGSGTSSIPSSSRSMLSGMLSQTTTITTAALKTIKTVETSDGSTFSTTFASEFRTTYTTALPKTTSLAKVTASGNSTISSMPAKQTTSGVGKVAVSGGVVGAAIFVAWALT